MKKYNIGLDIGTSSVGWAVVSPENFKIIRKGNKYLWGARLFDGAEVAESRRVSRSTRRRYDRRRVRIKYIREIFKNDIDKVDCNFFKKMSESFFLDSDNVNKTIVLSENEKKLFKDYQIKYPTIYHLRDELVNSKEKADIRLIYLAIHHIIKYRGHFNYEGDNFDTDKIDLITSFTDLMFLSDEILKNDSINIDGFLENFSEFTKYLSLTSKNDKKVNITAYFKKFMPKYYSDEFVKLLCGNKFNVVKMLDLDIEKKIEIKFSDSSFDDKFSEYETLLGEHIEIVTMFKNLYDIIYLKNLFGETDATTISALMVEKYNKHKEDLDFLRKICKFDKKVYNKFFQIDGKTKGIYSSYIRNGKTYDEFCCEVKKIIDSLNVNLIDSETCNLIEIKKIEMLNDKFMPRLSDSNNGKYPYQLNKSEIISIINNQGVYYPALCEKVDEIFKIVKILEFKIPYYVGPLNNTSSVSGVLNKNSWLIRKSDDQITPYNFDKVVDKDATALEFIERMLSSCTYLLNEKVMPAQSILYSEFKVLNELKNIKVNGNLISWSFAIRIYEELFLNTRSINESILTSFIRTTGEYDFENFEITGYGAHKKFANNMSSYIDFFGDDGYFENTEYEISDAELIIKYITVFEDKNILKSKLIKEFPQLNDFVINKLLTKKYSGWSSMSMKLLVGLKSLDKSTNTYISIMDLMRASSKNFMKILYDKSYNFQKLIDDENIVCDNKKISYSLVSPLATSPANKRGIYQALKIIDEIVMYMGYQPENIVLEMARTSEEKKRKDSRKDTLLKIYSDYKKDIYDFNRLNSELKGYEKIDSEQLFLYFTQEGKCLYSGESLDINSLKDYEVDHIVPRSLTTDNSIANKALVLKRCNQEKSASFVLPSEYRKNQKKFWEKLLKQNLICPKKFYNLNKSVYKPEEIEGFISRQIVETRQICKHVANILDNIYENTGIIYLHANLSSNYRKKHDLFKFREINNYHHAHDAYLACVLGDYQKNYLNRKVDFELLKEYNKYLWDNKLYKDIKYGYVINSLDSQFLINKSTGELIFDAELFNKTVINNLYRNDIIVTKKCEIRKGELFQETKNAKGMAGVEIKDNMPTKLYGSYTSLKPAYALLVRFTKKNKVSQKLVGIPIYYDLRTKKDNSILISYIKKLLGLTDIDTVDIISNKIQFNSKLNWDNQICYLVGATDTVEVANATEFHFSKDEMNFFKHILRALYSGYGKDNIVDYDHRIDELLKLIYNKISSHYKLYENLLPEIDNIINRDLSLENKELVIKELFKLLKANSTYSNLKFIDGSSGFGRKNGKSITNFKRINTSVSGLWENIDEF